MARTHRLVAGAALVLTALTGSAYADDVNATVSSGDTAIAIHVDDPSDGSSGGARVAARAAGQEADFAADPAHNLEPIGNIPGGPKGARSAVVGYISIQNATYTPQQALTTAPQVTLSGALNDGNLWSCGVPATFNPALPYTVTCTPKPSVVLSWDCDVLHTDISTIDETAQARTSMDCDGDFVAEAVTKTATGNGLDSHDSVWAAADIPVSTFSCTVDNGSGLGPIPRYHAGCGDPGVPELEFQE